MIHGYPTAQFSGWWAKTSNNAQNTYQSTLSLRHDVDNVTEKSAGQEVNALG